MHEDEEWRPVVGYEGFYEVSNLGRVRSLDRVIDHGRNGSTNLRGRILSASVPDKKHYSSVGLSAGGAYRHAMVHTLVATAFIGPRPIGMECCHNDGDKNNNRADNLRWDTPSANQLDRRKHGTHGQPGRPERTHCKYGHELTPENSFTRPDSGTLRCRTCHRQAGRNSERRAKERRPLTPRTSPRPRSDSVHQRNILPQIPETSGEA